jgi:probable rRNA maturation factor
MIEVFNRSGINCPENEVTKLLTFSMKELGLSEECELTLTFIDDAEMEQLHINWMNLPGSTDVMSFPMDELKPHDSTPGILGDIVISPTVAKLNAEKAGHSVEHEIKILAAHGLLHLLGYDHQELTEEKVMFALQEDLVKRYE